MRAHHAVDAVAVGQRQRPQAKRVGLLDQFFGMACAFEEREVGGEDALEEEIRAFIRAVQKRSTPIVSGQDGLQALEEAERIVEVLEIP